MNRTLLIVAPSLLLLGGGLLLMGKKRKKTLLVDAATLKTSRAGLKAIKAHEGLRLQPYDDQAGYCTVGVGHLLHKSRCTGAERTLSSEDEALTLLADDVNTFEHVVRQKVKVPITQPQFDALVSFAFNVGPGAFNSSTLLRKLNEGDHQGAKDWFAPWNKVTINGVLVPSDGLTKRRAAEAEMFGTGIA